MKKLTLLVFLLIIGGAMNGQNKEKKVLNIIAIGAHPDDCDYKFGGTAALYVKLGHNVKFLALTNGEAGHQSMGGGILAKRRRKEARHAGKILGVTYEVLENEDGELLPSIHVRKQVIRKIREWDADVVLGLRPNDYHPDHRNAGIVVQDAAYLVIVPNIVSDTPPLKNNPVFLYMNDHFQKPYPLSNDIAVVVDNVFDIKMKAIAAHESQVFEWGPWTNGIEESKIPQSKTDRLIWLKNRHPDESFDQNETRAIREWYSDLNVSEVQHAEFFEVCEYGKQPTDEEIRKLFPMIGK